MSLAMSVLPLQLAGGRACSLTPAWGAEGPPCGGDSSRGHSRALWAAVFSVLYGDHKKLYGVTFRQRATRSITDKSQWQRDTANGGTSLWPQSLGPHRQREQTAEANERREKDL